MWQGVLSEDVAEAAPAHSLRRAAVRLPSLRQALRRPLQHDATLEITHRCKAVFLYDVSKIFYEKASSEISPELPHWIEALLLSPL